ncbi:MAG: YitT family protein [Oscillospiraceae bacterium]|nr:YitT family protein [Oscillospiraceae bacterium]
MDRVKKTLRDLPLLTLGTFLVAAGVYFFKFPNQFNTGGVTGLAVILNAVFPTVSASVFASLINIAFLVIGVLFVDKSFGVNTIYCSVMFSTMLSGLEWLCPLSAPLTDQKTLELFFAVILPSLGSAILFNMQSSTGGTDILAMILKRFSSMDIGNALLCVDVLIAASTLYFVGIEAGLYSVLGLVLKSVVVDTVIESLNRRKSFLAVTSCPDQVCHFITYTLNRSATYWQASGAYTHDPKWVVLTALSRSQAVALRLYLKSTDPHAFILVTNSSEIFGKGFMRV